METAGRAAGDHDEDEREHRGRPLRVRVEDGGRERRVGEEETGVHRRDARPQQQAVQIVAGLQQQPDRQHAGGERVRQQEPFPLRQRGADERVADAGRDQQQHHQQPGAGQHPEVPAEAVEGDAHPERGQHEQGGGQHRLRVERRREEGGHDVHEHAHRQRDQKEDEQMKQRPGPPSDQALGHLAERQAPGADRDGEGAEVVHGAHEDGAQHDPRQGRKPAPDDGDGRTEQRRQTGDGGELVPEQHVAVGRRVVDVVAQPMRRRRPFVVEREQAAGEMPGVEAPGGPVGAQGQQRHGDGRAHGGRPVPGG